jgi:NAD(P)-dependent dehydrogenase (short-subunit alcohol dehydrogenase family)
MLENKVIVITGGAGTIGREFCSAVLENNGICIISDSDIEKGENLKLELANKFNYSKVEYINHDISSKESTSKLVKSLTEKYGRIDAVVNNAYPRNNNYGKKFFDVEFSDFCQNLNLNLGGCFLVSQQFGAFFKDQGHGNIINIASIYGVIAPRFEIYEDTEMTMPVEYAAIKSALIHLTKYMAKYFKGLNIRVNCICPGGVYNNQPEQFVKKYNNYCISKGMISARDLNGTLLFLLSESSQVINGQTIIVDDGFSL